MTIIINILTDRYADWECALTMAAGRAYYGLDVRTATPGGTPVTSAGGLRITPDYAVEDLQLSDFDALLINGGAIWEGEDAPDISKLLKAAHAEGKIIGGICGATLALGNAGLLDNIKHTSNGADYLKAAPKYAGSALYQDVPEAVSDANVVTAAGTAPVSFMREVMTLLGKGGPELDFYTGLHAAEHLKAA